MSCRSCLVAKLFECKLYLSYCKDLFTFLVLMCGCEISPWFGDVIPGNWTAIARGRIVEAALGGGCQRFTSVVSGEQEIVH